MHPFREMSLPRPDRGRGSNAGACLLGMAYPAANGSTDIYVRPTDFTNNEVGTCHWQQDRLSMREEHASLKEHSHHFHFELMTTPRRRCTLSSACPFLPLHPSPLLPMSSTANSSSNFQSILDAALSDYTEQTGIDLATHPSAQTLQNCNSADAILDLLGNKAKQFQAYRDGNRKLINSLKPVVQVLHTVSGILGEAAAMVSLVNQLTLSHRILTVPSPGAIPTDKSDPCRC